MTTAPLGLALPQTARLAHLGADRTATRRWRVLAAFTLFRLALVPPIVVSFMASPTITALALGAFMVGDLLDGVVARRLQVDDAVRRALDSVVDRLAIDACLVAAWAADAMPLWLLAVFLIRDAYCAALCVVMFRASRAAIKTDLLYRGLSFLIAVWALAAPFVSADVRDAWMAALTLAAVVVAVDLTRCVSTVLRLPEAYGAVVPASRARRGHARRRWRGLSAQRSRLPAADF